MRLARAALWHGAVLLACAGLVVAAAPAGATVAYVGAGQTLWVARDDGGGARIVATGASDPSISPSGRVVVARLGEALTLFDAEGGADPRVLAVRTSAVAWAPDERFLLTYGPRDEAGRSPLLRIDVATGAARVLTRGPAANVSLAPDGRRVVFERLVPGYDPGDRRTHGSDLFAVSTGGGPVRRLTGDRRSAEPVATSAGVFFLRADPGAYGSQLWLRRTDGQARRVSTEGIGNPYGLLAGAGLDGASTDGRRVLVGEFEKRETWLRVIDTRTGRTLRRAAGSGQIARDGRTLLVTRYDALIRVPLDPPGPEATVARPAFTATWTR